MKKVFITELIEKFSEFYNSVKFTGKSMAITNNGDKSSTLICIEDIYPEVPVTEMSLMNTNSKAFNDVKNDDDLYS